MSIKKIAIFASIPLVLLVALLIIRYKSTKVLASDVLMPPNYCSEEAFFFKKEEGGMSFYTLRGTKSKKLLSIPGVEDVYSSTISNDCNYLAVSASWRVSELSQEGVIQDGFQKEGVVFAIRGDSYKKMPLFSPSIAFAGNNLVFFTTTEDPQTGDEIGGYKSVSMDAPDIVTDIPSTEGEEVLLEEGPGNTVFITDVISDDGWASTGLKKLDLDSKRVELILNDSSIITATYLHNQSKAFLTHYKNGVFSASVYNLSSGEAASVEQNLIGDKLTLYKDQIYGFVPNGEVIAEYPKEKTDDYFGRVWPKQKNYTSKKETTKNGYTPLITGRNKYIYYSEGKIYQTSRPFGISSWF